MRRSRRWRELSERERVALVGAHHREAARKLGRDDLAAEAVDEGTERSLCCAVEKLHLHRGHLENGARDDARRACPHVGGVLGEIEVHPVFDAREHGERHATGNWRPSQSGARKRERDGLARIVDLNAALLGVEPADDVRARCEPERRGPAQHFGTNAVRAEVREQPPTKLWARVHGTPRAGATDERERKERRKQAPRVESGSVARHESPREAMSLSASMSPAATPRAGTRSSSSPSSAH